MSVTDHLERLRQALADRYVVEREIGSGGMATVYLAEDRRHHRKVALKLLRPELAATLGADRFLREIEIAARLHHPHILPLYDSGEAEGLLYYVMPYEEGQSLRQRLQQEGELPIADVVRLVRDIADALEHAHAHGVVHRDIKPENILLSGRHALVMDFGVAKAVSAASGPKELTTAGVTLGTPAYMAPEQAAADSHIDHRADIYAAGVVAYELLTGEPPFTGETAQAVLAAQVLDRPAPVTERRETVPLPLARAVMACLEKNPADRWQSAGELLAQLEGFVTPSGGVTPTAARAPAVRRSAGRRARGLLIAALTAALVVAGVALREPIGGALGLGSGGTARRPWILVAAFDGADPGLAEVARALVSTALDESGAVATVPRSQVRIALRLAGRADTARVDAELARELAVRNGIGAVVDGRVDSVGATYSVVLRVVEAESGNVLASESAVVEDQSELIPTIDELSRGLRAAMGQRPRGRTADRPLTSVATPSFEAFRKYAEGARLWTENRDRAGARARLSEALALDPDFAGAWAFRGHTFWLEDRDSVTAHYEEALRRADRLTDWQRANVEGLVALNQNDLRAGVQIYQRLARENRYLNNCGLALGLAGRFEEAVTVYERAAQRSPVRPSALVLGNQLSALLQLQRFDEARRVAQRLDSIAPQETRLRSLTFAAVEADWPRVERLAAEIGTDPASPLPQQVSAAFAAAAAAAGGGSVGRAAGGFASLRRQAERSGVWDGAYYALLGQLLLVWYSEGSLDPPAPPEGWGPSAWSEAAQALWMGSIGDTGVARRHLAALTARPEHALGIYGALPSMLSAVIASRGERWQEVTDLLGPTAYRGYEVGRLEMSAGRWATQWLVATAYEHLGRGDSAAVYYERLLSPAGSAAEISVRGLAYPFAHRRLALVYGQGGERDGAVRHWRAFLETFTTPGPEVVWMKDQAERELGHLSEATGRS